MWEKEQIISELQRNGKRVTEQRKVLLDVILEDGWTCCKEIYYEASKRDPSIGIATVYRMLNALEEIGVLNRRYQYLYPAGEGEIKHCFDEKDGHGGETGWAGAAGRGFRVRH